MIVGRERPLLEASGTIVAAFNTEAIEASVAESLNQSFRGYNLLEQIGVGGRAEVYLARHSGLAGFEKDLVIKKIRPHLSGNDAFVNMFLGEAKLAAQLAHANIVQIYDLGKIRDSYFIAMEYIPGRDMSAVIPKAKKSGIPFPVEYALKVISNICEALYYAHTKVDAFGMRRVPNSRQRRLSGHLSTFQQAGCNEVFYRPGRVDRLDHVLNISSDSFYGHRRAPPDRCSASGPGWCY